MPKYKLKRNTYKTAKNRSDITLSTLLSLPNNKIVSPSVSHLNNASVETYLFSDNNVDEHTEIGHTHVTRENTEDLESINSLSSSSSDEIEEENLSNLTNRNSNNSSLLNQDATETFTQFISNWASHFKIPHVAINPLLSSINSHFNINLPSDARTILKTPRKVNIQFIQPGQYYHFGVSVAVTKLLNKYNNRENLQCIKICINVDGLPISKSNGSQLYPILCNLHQNFSVVEMIGLYHGFDKPKDANSLLASSINEIIQLTNNGFCFNGKTYPFQVLGFICDAPAKSFICYIKGHTGYHSCTKCYVEGNFVNNRVCFSQIDNLRLRNDQDFREKFDEDHHSGVSLIESIPNFNLVKNIPLDPMHLIYLGVMRKLLLIWVDGKPPHKLPSIKISKISELLIEQKKNIPSEFIRKPRTLQELKRYKATEFRQFLCYTGPLVLKSELSCDKYLNFLCLHVSTIILSHMEYLNKNGNYAHDLLKYFVRTFIFLYGEQYASHNIHNLLHIYEDSKIFGILEKFSAFPFENYLQKLKKLIRKGDKPLAQIIKRKIEEDNCETITNRSDSYKSKDGIPKYQHNNGPLLKNFEGCEQFKEVYFESCTLKLTECDSCCYFNDNSIVCIKNFVKKGQNVFVIGQKFQIVEDFYVKPCKSSEINVFLVSGLGPLQVWNLHNFKFKFVKMSYRNKFLVVPLFHTS